MTNLLRSIFAGRAARRLAAALFALLLLSPAAAQETQPARWLLVFDTSSAMKKRLPAVEAVLKNLFIESVGGQLQAGDSVGVWTFNRELNTGQFPLIAWRPEFAAATTSNLVHFLHEQHYRGDTRFAALQPALDQVIRGSERLTIILFCDGEDKITWTPYNDGINQTFQKNAEERKKSRQPFMLVLRTQRGKYDGCTVNFPPSAINLPSFPPLPQPVKAHPTNPPAVKPPPVAPLIIIGTDKPAAVAPSKPLPVPATNSPSAVVPATNRVESAEAVPPVSPKVAAPTNSAVSVATNTAPATNALLAETVTAANQSTVATNTAPVLTQTNAAPAPDADRGMWSLIILGGGLLLAAAGFLTVLVVRARRPRGSLITSSLNQPRTPPERK
jgi:hypothetical protein